MFEKAKSWCKNHSTEIAIGCFTVAGYVLGVSVGRCVERSSIERGLDAMVLADPTLLDHLMIAGNAVKNTCTKINNF